MTMEHVPPYEAVKSGVTGVWYIADARGYFVGPCDCRAQAEECARDLNKHFVRERGRHCGLTDEQIDEAAWHAALIEVRRSDELADSFGRHDDEDSPNPWQED